MTTNPHDRRLADFARILGLERNLLEYLLYKLVAARLLMAGTDPRYIIQSLVEVEDALDRVREIAGKREAALTEIARAVGLERDQLTISRLAEIASPATRFVMYELKHEYVRLAHQIEQVSSDNKRLADLALSTTAEVLKNLAGSPAGVTYDQRGSSHQTQPRPVRLDEVI